MQDLSDTCLEVATSMLMAPRALQDILAQKKMLLEE